MATLCVRPQALSSISSVACGVNLGQIVAVLFQRAQAAPSFATEAAMKSLAAWTPLLAANDGTKVVKSPEFAGFKVPGSEPVFVGENSNDSIDGLATYVGSNAVRATGVLLSMPAGIVEQLKEYEAESAAGLQPGLSAYFITGDGRLVSDNLAGFEINSFFVGSRNLDGFRTQDKSAFGFAMAADWDKNMLVTTPAFNPRRALVNA